MLLSYLCQQCVTSYRRGRSTQKSAWKEIQRSVIMMAIRPAITKCYLGGAPRGRGGMDDEVDLLKKKEGKKNFIYLFGIRTILCSKLLGALK